MIKLKNLLKEESIKIDIKNIKDVNFGIHSNGITIIFIPKTSKDVDKLDELGFTQYQIQDILVEYCKKKLRGFEFDRSISYKGAGFGVDLDMDSLIKKLR